MIQEDITFLISTLGAGGSQKVCVSMINKFVNDGIPVSLIVLNLNNSVYHKNIDKRISFTNLRVNHARNSIIRLARYINRKKPGLFLVFNHQLAILLVLLRWFLFKKFRIISRNISNLTSKIIQEPSFWHKYIVSCFVRVLYKKVDKVIAQSYGMKEDLIKNFGFNPEKIIVIHNPISPDIENGLQNFDIANVKKRHEIVFVGRLDHVKGLSFLLEAFRLVKSTDKLLKLRIIGDGPLKNEIVRIARDGNILEDTIFEGFQKNIFQYLQYAKLTVLTSLHEGFPNVLVESIAVGTPVISFDCPSGPGEIIKDGVNGYLVKYKDVNDLVDKILAGLEKEWDPELIRETSKRFSSSRIIPEYKKVLSDV